LKDDLCQDLRRLDEHSTVNIEVLGVLRGMGDDVLDLVQDIALHLIVVEVVYCVLCSLLSELLVFEQFVGYHKTLVVSLLD
jgi:hypothetical protein